MGPGCACSVTRVSRWVSRTSMDASANERLAAILRAHPALLVSAVYVAASVIGMFYAWAYLRQFAINVFNYAQISDFLIASLKEPFTWVLVVFAVALIMLDNANSRRVERKKPGKWIRWYGSPGYRFLNNFVTIALVLLSIYAYADFQADKTRGGDGKLVTVALGESSEIVTATLLGTTGQFVFLYRPGPGVERVDIHPIESIHSISFTAQP